MKYARSDVAAYLPSSVIRRASRDTFRLALFLCMTPRWAARMMTGSACLNAARAALRSPLWIASSTLRIEFRSNERRALFTSVRRAITRVALRADLVLAINLSFAAGASSGRSAKATRFYKKLRRRTISPSRLRLIDSPCAGVNARKRPSGHPFGSNRVVACDHRSTLSCREWCQRRPYACKPRIAMDMSEQRLHARHQRLSVKQLADCNRRVERSGVALTPRARAQIGVEIGGRRDAARKKTRARIDQACFRGREDRKVLRYSRRGTGECHVAGGILQAHDADRKRFQKTLDQCDMPGQS